MPRKPKAQPAETQQDTPRATAPFTYVSGLVPAGYVCTKCLASGVRLYRWYMSSLNDVDIRCRACTIAERGSDAILDAREHSIGGRVAAIPTEDGATYWGYLSVPPAGVKWWNDLPKETKKHTPLEAQLLAALRDLLESHLSLGAQWTVDSGQEPGSEYDGGIPVDQANAAIAAAEQHIRLP